ncbi:MAG: cell division protein FtsW [Planctomycetes bacterium]|nr:cell division protein FtsW [Planctomycetota bacterium]
MTAISGSRQPIEARSNRSHLRELDWLMLATVGLCCLGLVMAVSVQGADPDVGPIQAMKQQGGKLFAALAAFLVAALTPMQLVRRVALPAFLVATVLAWAAPGDPGAVEGAYRWIQIGACQFQPVELARFFLISSVAWMLARAGDNIRTFWRGFAPPMVCAGVVAGGLLQQPDHGSALIVLSLAAILSVVAGVRMLHFLPFGVAGLIGFGALAIQHGYVVDRLTGFLQVKPASQVGQSLVAIAAGGPFGRGLGQGWMKMGFVPEAQNDFVFAIVAEELGYVGSLLVLALFTVIGVVGYRLVCRIRDPFLRFLVCGYSLMLCMQAAVNLLVVSGWAPAKGIDLPFVSTGGTSLVFGLAAVGLIGNAARQDLGSQVALGGSVPGRQ